MSVMKTMLLYRMRYASQLIDLYNTPLPNSVDELISLLSEPNRRFWAKSERTREYRGLDEKAIGQLRNEIAEKSLGLSTDRVESEFLGQLCQWLGITLAVHDGVELVRSVTNTEHFVLAVLNLEAFVINPASRRHSETSQKCIQTIVGLLLQVAKMKTERFESAQNMLVASLLLCTALRTHGKDIQQCDIQADVREDLLERSELYKFIGSTSGDVGDIVEEACRLYLE